MSEADGSGGDLSHSFSELASAFDQASLATGGVIEHCYDIAGFPVRLGFAGPTMVPYVTPAFAHLSADRTVEPALSICIWDTVSTGTPRPSIPWVRRDDQRVGTGRRKVHRRFYAFFEPVQNAVSMLDADRNVGLYCIPDARALPYNESGAPLRVILHWWMATKGLQLVHAGAVGSPAGGVLLIGKAGSGKSTAALACLLAGLSYAGDDYALVQTEPSPRVFGLYNSGKLDAEHLQRFSGLGSAVWNADRLATEKALIFVHQRYPTQASSGFPLQAVVLPSIWEGTECALQEISASAALAALASSTIFLLPGAGEAAFETLARLIRQVPSFVLRLGSDLSRIAPAVSRLLEGVHAHI